MSLILAIEPDRRQAAQLTHIVRQRVGAELVLADTTERALESIGNRIPDLVLIPALISPQDDAALATALRVIATAARVQMLTIPVLATNSPKRSARRGVLSSLLGDRGSAQTPDGCDPAVFAEQISSYLASAAEERAAEQRAAAFDEDDHVATPATVERPPIAPSLDDGSRMVQEFEEPARAEAVDEQSVVIPRFARSEPSVIAAPEPFVVAAIEPPLAAAPEPSVVAAREQRVLSDAAASAPHPVESHVDEPRELLQLPAAAPSAFEQQLAVLENAALPVIEDVQAAEWDHISEDLQADGGDDDDADDIDLTAVLEQTATPEETPDPMYAAAAQIDAHKPTPPIDMAALFAVDSIETITRPEPLFVAEPIEPIEQLEPMFAAEPPQTMPAPTAEADAATVQEFAEGDSAEADADFDWPVVTPLVAAVPMEELLADRRSDAMADFANAVDALEPVADDLWPQVAVEPWEPVGMGTWRAWPSIAMEGTVSEVPLAVQMDVADAVAVAAPEQQRPAAAQPAPDRAEHPQWVDLVASLRRDIERLRTERVQPPAPVAAAPAAAKPEPPAAVVAARPKPRPAKPRPLQDEWGFFDPEQCGFAALLAKLDEITDKPDDAPKPRPV